MTAHLVLIDQSHTPGLDSPTLHRIALAVGSQLTHHVAPAWDRRAPRVTVATSAAAVPAKATPLYLLDDSDQANALGYHDEDPQGRPYARVFTRPILDHGGTLTSGPLSVSAVVSHEACEWLGDASCQQWASVLQNRLLALELCDPVEQDCYDVAAAGQPTSVSNFVLPAYFDPQAPGPYDWLHELTKPGMMSRGGYLIEMVEGKVSQVFGEQPPPEWRLESKRLPGARTHRRGAANTATAS